MSLNSSQEPVRRPEFHRLEITDVRRETDEAVSIAFSIPGELEDAFRFTPGQYLTLKTTLDGEAVRRTYSIASGLDDGETRVAIKRVEGGLFSAFANEKLRAGDTMDVMPPAGRFVLPPPTGPRTVAAFAAGAGITPIASQIRTLLVREPASRAFLFYGNQTARSIMFREEFEDLKDRFLDRFSIHNVLSRENQEVDALTGRIDADKLGAFMRHVVPLSAVDHFVLCGPAPFLNDLTAALDALGVPREKVLLERFTTPKGRPPLPEQKVAEAEGAAISITLDGVTSNVRLGPDEPILDAALRAGLDAPYSCRGGMCCTCRAKLVSGKVTMAANYSLRDDEVADGFILTCQSRVQSADAAVDYDAV